MTRLAVSVEGPTEEEFMNRILGPYLREEVGFSEVQPIILGRAKTDQAGGGNVTVKRLVSEMARLMGSYNAVTSLVDFYGFRKKGNHTVDELIEMVRRCVKNRSRGNVREGRIIQYIQMYEFEGMLFSDVEAFRVVEGADSDSIDALRRIQRDRSPEEINDNKNTAPSKLMLSVLRKYNKLVDGPMVAKQTGLEKIRSECPRFNAWVDRLEKLPASMQSA